jgi:hypothetical protein
MSQRAWLSALFAAVLAVLPLACDGGPSSPDGMGRLNVRLTDAPVADASEINVHIVGLTVKRVGSPVERIADNVGVFDLLELTDSEALLATREVAAGDYEFIQVDLSEEGSSITEAGTGDEFPVHIASSEVKILNGFRVRENGTTNVLLDFDAAASLRHLGDGSWLLTPVILHANSDEE